MGVGSEGIGALQGVGGHDGVDAHGQKAGGVLRKSKGQTVVGGVVESRRIVASKDQAPQDGFQSVLCACGVRIGKTGYLFAGAQLVEHGIDWLAGTAEAGHPAGIGTPCRSAGRHYPLPEAGLLSGLG